MYFSLESIIAKVCIDASLLYFTVIQTDTMLYLHLGDIWIYHKIYTLFCLHAFMRLLMLIETNFIFTVEELDNNIKIWNNKFHLIFLIKFLNYLKILEIAFS